MNRDDLEHKIRTTLDRKAMSLTDPGDLNAGPETYPRESGLFRRRLVAGLVAASVSVLSVWFLSQTWGSAERPESPQAGGSWSEVSISSGPFISGVAGYPEGYLAVEQSQSDTHGVLHVIDTSGVEQWSVALPLEVATPIRQSPVDESNGLAWISGADPNTSNAAIVAVDLSTEKVVREFTFEFDYAFDVVATDSGPWVLVATQDRNWSVLHANGDTGSILSRTDLQASQGRALLKADGSIWVSELDDTGEPALGVISKRGELMATDPFPALQLAVANDQIWGVDLSTCKLIPAALTDHGVEREPVSIGGHCYLDITGVGNTLFAIAMDGSDVQLYSVDATTNNVQTVETLPAGAEANLGSGAHGAILASRDGSVFVLAPN